MLDPEYRYDPYLDNDENNETQYRYDQSALLRTYLQLPDLPQAESVEQTDTSTYAKCVDFPWPETQPVQGLDVQDMIAPNFLTDAHLTKIMVIQFGRDRNIRVIPVSVT